MGRAEAAAGSGPGPEIVRTCEPLVCCDADWESAYLRFESSSEETLKFRRRLLRLGADGWARDARIVELFCGRGNALHAWHGLGFAQVEGVDLSERLLRQFRGCAKLYVADARQLPFEPESRDIVSVQGGLHHLDRLPDDLDRTLASAARVLRPGGRFIAVEPWLTPFLRCVHRVSRSPLARRLSPRLDAFAIMVERERSTYEAWLAAGPDVIECLRQHFEPLHLEIGFGKLAFVGLRR